jgi:hypothetical protein
MHQGQHLVVVCLSNFPNHSHHLNVNLVLLLVIYCVRLVIHMDNINPPMSQLPRHLQLKKTHPYSVDIVDIQIVKKIKGFTFYPVLDPLCN